MVRAQHRRTLKSAHRVAPLMLNIRNVRHLAQRLNLPLELLENVVEYLHLHYGESRQIAKKASGQTRSIDAPRPLLKRIQRRINQVLLADLWLPDCLHAYRHTRSTKTAAAPHAGRGFMWVADIRRFYPSISSDRVYYMFLDLGCSPDVSSLLTRLTTRKHCLPQGTPTSPGLANLYLWLSGTAARLEGLCRKHNLNMTFFGDDLLISGDKPFNGLTKHFEDILESAALRLNRRKTGSVAGPHERHQALGLVMNSDAGQINVPRSYRRRLRAVLRLCQRRGPAALAHCGITNKDPRAYLGGMIAFTAYINPGNAVLKSEMARIDWGDDRRRRAPAGNQHVGNAEPAAEHRIASRPAQPAARTTYARTAGCASNAGETRNG
jgi:RNA-directed DNA polymerase